MNHEDELARRIAKVLDEASGELAPRHRERLSAARRLALSRQQRETSSVWVPAWAGPISRLTEQSVLGARYAIAFAALVLGLLGVVYVHTGSISSDIADIDAGLLTDELPLSAFLDQGFDSWLKRSSH